MGQTARSCTTSILIQAIDPDTFECVPDEQIPLQGKFSLLLSAQHIRWSPGSCCGFGRCRVDERDSGSDLMALLRLFSTMIPLCHKSPSPAQVSR